MTMLMPVTLTTWSSAVHPSPPYGAFWDYSHRAGEKIIQYSGCRTQRNIYGAEGIPKNAGVQLKIKMGNAGVTSEVADFTDTTKMMTTNDDNCDDGFTPLPLQRARRSPQLGRE